MSDNLSIIPKPDDLVIKLEPESDVVGADTKLLVTAHPVNTISVGGKLQMTFPKWNAECDQPHSMLYFSSMFDGPVSCEIVSGIPVVDVGCEFKKYLEVDVLVLSGGFDSEL